MEMGLCVSGLTPLTVYQQEEREIISLEREIPFLESKCRNHDNVTHEKL